MVDKATFTVRLIDKVKGPASSAEKALGKLSSKAMGLSATSASLTKVTGRTGAALGMLGRASAGASRGLGGALDVFKGNLITMAAQKTLGLAAAVAETGFEFITLGQNSKMAFDRLAKHGAGGSELLGHSDMLAKRLGLDLIDTRKQYQKFLALQFTPKAIDGLIKMGSDLRALGTDAEGVQGVFMALGQIKGKGRLQGEELVQLAERGISTALVQEEIGKALGVSSMAQVQKLQQAGKVTADVGLKAIERALNRKLQQGKLGESGKKFADQTISGMLGRFKALGQDAGFKAFDRAAAPITKVLGRTLDKLITFVDSPAGAKLIDQIAGSVERLVEAGAELGGEFAKQFIEADWKGIARDIGDITGGMVEASKAGLELAKAFGLIKFRRTDSETTPEHRHFGKGLAAGAAAGALLGSVFPGVGTGIGAAGGAILGGLSAALPNAGIDLGLSLSDGLSSDRVLGSAHAAGKAIGDSTSAGTRDALGIHSPSRVAMADGVQVARGLAIGMRRGGRYVEDASASLAGRIDGFGPGSFASVGPSMSSLSVPAVDGARGPSRISVTLHTEVHGAGGDAEEIGRVAASASRRELEAFFRQLSLEG